MANTKNIQAKLDQLKMDTNQLVVELQKLRAEGKSATSIYAELSKKIGDNFEALRKGADSVARSFKQTKDIEQYNKNLEKLAAMYKKVEQVQSKAVRAANKEQEAILKGQEALRKRIADGNKRRSKEVSDFEIRMAKRREAVLKKIREKKESALRIDERNQIARFKRIVAAEKKAARESVAAEREKEAARKKSSISGGFGAQFSGRAIGGALGSLSKYLGLYRLITGAVQVLNELTIESAKRAIAFEKALGDLSAIVGLTTSETKKLGDEIFNVAGSTSFTALEIAELQKQLGKLGASADEIVKLTRPVALLAQALGEDPGSAAASLKKFLNQFQETTEESSNFANIMVAAVNESALSLESLSTAMQYVGPLANQVGLTFDQTAAYLGILADNGFTASRAGTGLRAVLSEAAKEGIEFGEFLEKVGDEGLNAAKAFDIFGKRGAAAAVTLVQNQQKFKDLNAQLLDSDRLFQANAKQMATTQGQIDLLSSAYNKFSTNLGSVITQTNFFINLIAIFDKESAGLAQTYKILADSSTKTKEAISSLKDELRIFSDEGQNFADVNILLGESLQIMRETGEYSDAVLRETYADLRFQLKQGKDLQEAIEFLSKRTGQGELRLLMATKQLVATLKEQAEIEDRLYVTKQAQSEELERYAREYRDLLSVVQDGTDIEEEKQLLSAQIQTDILNKMNEIVALEASGVLTYEQSLRKEILQEQIDNLNKQLVAVQSLSATEETLAQKKKREEKEKEDAFKKALKAIQDRRKAAVEAANEEAKVETAVSKTASRRADVERKRTQTVSDLYATENAEILALMGTFGEYADKINEAAGEAEKLSKVLTSDIIDDVTNAVNDYAQEIESLDKKLADGTITQEEYNAARDTQYETLKANIENFKSLGDVSPEVAAFFDEIMAKALSAGYAIQQVPGEAEKTWKDFVDQFKNGGNLEYIEEAIQRTGEVLSDFNDVQLENTKNRIKSELEAIKGRYETEDYLAKQQFENGLINEEQYRRKQKELRKAQLQEENKLGRELFEAEKKQERQDAIINAAVSTGEVVIDSIRDWGFPLGLSVGAAMSSLIAAQLGGQLSAIGSKKFYEKKFAMGGLVEGPSHAQGGVPFTVQGQGGYEMEGGEFIVNKKASALHRQLLESINNSVKPNVVAQPAKFATGGVVSNTVVNNNGIGESVNYLKAIAEATTSTAIQTSKPVRAFVTSTDLKKDETARRIKENNTTI